MKKILIVVLLLQNWSVFGQVEIKLNLAALVFKRADLGIEFNLGRLALQGDYELSKPEPVSKVIPETRTGYGGSFRFYFAEKNQKNRIYCGYMYRTNTQKFQTNNSVFKRDEKFKGLLFGDKIKLNSRFGIDICLGYSPKSFVSYEDITRDYRIIRTAPPAFTIGSCSYGGTQPRESKRNNFFFNLALTYKIIK